MIKTLSKVGNSRALVLDRTLINLLHLDDSNEVEIEVHGDTMLVRSTGKSQRAETLSASSRRLMDRFDSAYQRLAK